MCVNHVQVSIVTTPDHDMYVRAAGASEAAAFEKVPAGTLLGRGAPGSIQMLACASAGLPSTTPAVFDATALRLKNEEQVHAFLELYGYWAASSVHHTPAPPSTGEIVLTAAQQSEMEWLRRTFQQLALPWQCARSAPSNHIDECAVSITDAAYVAAFTGQQKTQQPAGATSGLSTLLQLGVLHARAVLHGLRRASSVVCAAEESVFCTPSEHLRDDVLRLALHAGFSAHFDAVRADASHCTWVVRWCAPDTAERDTHPVLDTARDVKATTFSGRTWCVTMPSGFIMARRVSLAADSGALVAASRPLIIGN
ncbi:hypothetical protein EON67_06125, partial [archaeon]